MRNEIHYCEGWDATGRHLAGPLTEATARRRDAAGEQYAVLITADGRPRGLIQVCWSAHYAEVFFFDDEARRDRRIDFRRTPDDRLVLFVFEHWVYPESDTAEFDGNSPWFSVEHGDAGNLSPGTRRWGDRTHPPLPELERPVPDFGDWAAFPGLPGLPHDLVTVPDPVETGEPAPWSPPRPIQPQNLGELFRPGAFELDFQQGPVTGKVELGSAGRVRLPSGKLIIADPDPWMHEREPFTEPVAPGEYPVEISRARFDDNDEIRVAAAKVTFTDRPVAAWTQAHGEHDELFLGDGEFHGIGVDAGCVAFVDASVAQAFEDTIEDGLEQMTGLLLELPEPESGANLLVVSSGWGDGAYPIWAGRDADGGLAALIVDFQVLRHARF